MFGTPEINNAELRSDSTSGDVSEVESGLEVTKSEIDVQKVDSGEHMKFGLRTPSLKKSISARTTGYAKRAIQKI